MVHFAVNLEDEEVRILFKQVILEMLEERLERIVVDSQIMVGKPVGRGTRIPVELVLKRLVQNPNIGELLEAYPRLTVEDVKAGLEYAQGLVEGETVFPAPAGTA